MFGSGSAAAGGTTRAGKGPPQVPPLTGSFSPHVFGSAGLSWQEEAETYESSFYKRSLDNNLYIFTPSPYSGENCERALASFPRMCVLQMAL